MCRPTKSSRPPQSPPHWRSVQKKKSFPWISSTSFHSGFAGFFSLGNGGRALRGSFSARYINMQRHHVRRKGDLKVYYTNSRSLRNKINLLRGKACVEEFDIIALTETWIDTAGKKLLSEYKTEGYQLFHEDRKLKIHLLL